SVLSVTLSRVLRMSIVPAAHEVAVLPAPAGSAAAAVAELERVLDGVGDDPWSTTSGRAVLDLVARLGRVGSRVDALRLSGLAEADRQNAARGAGMTSTGAWLTTTGVRAGAARRDVELAAALTGLDQTRDAL